MSIATELTALSGHITNAYDAVQTKGGTIPANKNMANLDDAILSIQSGAGITNGTIAQAESDGANIPASTFLQATNISYSAGQEITFAPSPMGRRFKSVQLDESHFFNMSPTQDNLYRSISACIIDTTSGAVATGAWNVIATNTGTSTSYESTTDSTCIKIGDNKVLVVYYDMNPNNTANRALYGVVCSIANNTITAGTPALLATDVYQSWGNIAPSCILLNSSCIILKYGKTNSACNCVALSISGSSVTAGTPVVLSSAYRCSRVTVFKVNDNMFASVTNYNAYLFSVSSTVITAGASTSISDDLRTSDDVTGYGYGIGKIGDTTQYLIAHNDKYSVVDISGSSISKVESGSIPFSGGELEDQSYTSVLVRTSGREFLYIAEANVEHDGSTIKTFFTFNVACSQSGVIFDEIGAIDYDTVFPSYDVTQKSVYPCVVFGGDVLAVYARHTANATISTYAVIIKPGGGQSNRISSLGEVLSGGGAYSHTGFIFSTGVNALLTVRSYSTYDAYAVLFSPYLTVSSSTDRIDGVSIDDLSSSSSGDIWIFDNETFYGDANIRSY